MKIDSRNKVRFRDDADVSISVGPFEGLKAKVYIEIATPNQSGLYTIELDSLLDLRVLGKITVDLGAPLCSDEESMVSMMETAVTTLVGEMVRVEVVGLVPYDSYNQEFLYRDGDELTVLVEFLLERRVIQMSAKVPTKELRPFIDCHS